MEKALDKVEALAKGSKWMRLMEHPARYLFVQLIARSFYKKSGVVKQAETFFGATMNLQLPASADIYLTGGKTHDSEIRLARFAIQRIHEDDVVIDVGAHFGYFTLLFAALAKNGHVYAFEPSAANFALLKDNTAKKNISVFHKAVSRTEGTVTFYEFPVLFSESNSVYAEQYRDEAWFKSSGYKKTIVESISLDNFCSTNNISPRFIKIDVEGAEHDVIGGAENVARHSKPVIAMEFVCRERENKNHHAAKALLHSMGYTAHTINSDASLSPVADIDKYLEEKKLESDNIIFTAH